MDNAATLGTEAALMARDLLDAGDCSDRDDARGSAGDWLELECVERGLSSDEIRGAINAFDAKLAKWGW